VGADVAHGGVRAVSARGRAKSSAWSRYLIGFHNRNPGITEDILATAVSDDDGMTAYRWLLSAAPVECLALDVACGSAPFARIDTDRRWIGFDRSSGELAAAAGHGRSDLVQGEAGTLPFLDESFGLVVCSMALMLLDSVDVVLTEIHRVLLRSGTAIFLLPGSWPLSGRDRLRYLRLLAAFRQFQPAYPNRIHLAGLSGQLARAGLSVVEDDRRRFRYQIADRQAGRRFVESLYTPGLSHERVELAVGLTNRWIGSEVGIPLRRIVCSKDYPAS
jgi:SAM-dependent methyltransferase